MKKTNFSRRFVIIMAICISCLVSATSFAAAKDKTNPKITETLSTSDYTNTNVKITLKITDASGIKEVKWASGAKKISYFKKEGKSLKLSSKGTVTVTVKKNGTYTFYAVDKAGNSIKKKVIIKNIDTAAPVIVTKLSNTKFTNKSISASITTTDNLSGIDFIKFLSGKKTLEDFKGKGTLLSLSDSGSAKFNISKNGNYTVYVQDKAGNAAIHVLTVKNLDKTKPVVKSSYSIMNQVAKVKVSAKDEESGIKKAAYLKGEYTADAKEWSSKAAEISNLNSFDIKKSGKYTILAEDNAGNKDVSVIKIEMELRAVWISFLEFTKSKNYTETQFKAYVNEIYDNCVSMNMNAVIVQVRPFGDAMYPSKYFPWSYYASGTQGKALSYDPMSYMVDAAHSRGLEFHAWVNPYRVTTKQTDITTLSKDNPARKWSEKKETERNVLNLGGSLYYNPSVKEVQDLIIDGVKEIVNNYEVDGIHFDDYFYPSLGSSYTSNFDAKEYKTYAADCKAEGKEAKTIVQWRRDNVNTLVKKTYAAIKKIDSECVFGISPAGNINNLLSSSSYYVDIKTWLSSSEYVDYICPQIYWSFTHKTAPYKTILNDWVKLKTSDTVNLYVGLAAYRAGISEKSANSYGDIGWSQSNTILQRQVLYGRDTNIVDGYMFFRYEQMVGNTAKKEMQNVISILGN